MILICLYVLCRGPVGRIPENGAALLGPRVRYDLE